MAYEQLNFRVTKDSPSILEVEAAAVRLGINRNQLLNEGLKLMCALDKDSFAAIKAFFSSRQTVAEREFCAALVSGLKSGGAKWKSKKGTN